MTGAVVLCASAIGVSAWLSPNATNFQDLIRLLNFMHRSPVEWIGWGRLSNLGPTAQRVRLPSGRAAASGRGETWFFNPSN